MMFVDRQATEPMLGLFTEVDLAAQPERSQIVSPAHDLLVKLGHDMLRLSQLDTATYRLQNITPAAQGAEIDFILTDEPVLIGRSVTPLLRLGPYVSRRHLEVARTADCLRFTDTTSHYGSWLMAYPGDLR
ncbi:MAG: hypothetical protein JWN38_252 [Candidatus Saccharibacteria bacterium]|nr:hypothetical protein [Candidatus Saccharibacteria bacterium]